MKFKINPGEFRHQIIIQRFTVGVDDDNIPFETWDNLVLARAKVLNVRGDEYYQAQSINSKVSKTFYIRGCRHLQFTSKDRIIYDDTIYNILYVNDIEEVGHYIEFKCEVKG